MRFAVVLVVALVCSVASASEPGQPLDCSDWVFDEPGLSCAEVIPYNCESNPACFKGASGQVDNAGRFLWTRQVQLPQNCMDGGIHLFEIQIVATDVASGTEAVLARLPDKCTPEGTYGRIDRAALYGPEPITFDPRSGRLLFPISTHCGNFNCSICCGTYPHENQLKLVALSGFATTFEVLQTYTPQASALGFHVPYMPEGMAGADHFDSYWGTLTKPLDFTQAHPLACDYPAAAPHVGDYLNVADTVPTPAPGQGVYYVTAATYQGATRYGRKTTAGHLTGRDPALLPACVP